MAEKRPDDLNTETWKADELPPVELDEENYDENDFNGNEDALQDQFSENEWEEPNSTLEETPYDEDYDLSEEYGADHEMTESENDTQEQRETIQRTKEELKAQKKRMIHEAVILTVITLISGLLLGFVHELTKDPIRKQQEKASMDACRQVFSDVKGATFEKKDITISDELVEELSFHGVTIGTIYLAKADDGNEVGYVIESISSQGYGGQISLYVGITTEGILNDVSILEISETPGLGMKAQDVLIPQLHQKNVDEIKYTKTGVQNENEIDAISGATITTKAVTNAVNGALQAARELRGGASDE